MYRLKVIGILEQGFLKLISGMNAIGSFWWLIVMCLVAGDVLGRALFKHPLAGVPEIVKFSIAGVLFMQLPHVGRMGRHIRSTMIISRLSPKVQSVLDIPHSLLAALIFIAIFVASWSPTIVSWKVWEIEGTGALRIPTFPIRSLILLGSCLSAIYFIAKFVQSLLTICRRHKGG